MRLLPLPVAPPLPLPRGMHHWECSYASRAPSRSRRRSRGRNSINTFRATGEWRWQLLAFNWWTASMMVPPPRIPQPLQPPPHDSPLVCGLLGAEIFIDWCIVCFGLWMTLWLLPRPPALSATRSLEWGRPPDGRAIGVPSAKVLPSQIVTLSIRLRRPSMGDTCFSGESACQRLQLWPGAIRFRKTHFPQIDIKRSLSW